MRCIGTHVNGQAGFSYHVARYLAKFLHSSRRGIARAHGQNRCRRAHVKVDDAPLSIGVAVSFFDLQNLFELFGGVSFCVKSVKAALAFAFARVLLLPEKDPSVDVLDVGIKQSQRIGNIEPGIACFVGAISIGRGA